jgi:hypothetical protein
MCRATRCKSCGKTTWAGCGAHVAQVRSSVPAEQWCEGHADATGDGWLRRLLSR